MPQASEQVKAFFDEYERNIGASDSAALAVLYGDSFVFAGPKGAQAVRRDDFLKVLPKRQEFFKTAGLRSSTIQALEEARFGAPQSGYYEMDGLLKAHGVFLDLTLEDVHKDSDAALAPSR